MKKILLLGLMGLMGLSGLRAQTLIDNYRFSTRVDPAAWIDITGVDSALIATPDSGVARYGNSAVTDIGFAEAIAKKLAALDAALAGLGKGVVADADLVRFGWLRSHLVASRELDANLWRLRRLKRQRELGKPTDALQRQLDEGLAKVRALKRDFPRELGSPVPLMADICSEARE